MWKEMNSYYFYCSDGNRVKKDGVGPVDNRPSTDTLHHFVKKNNNKKNM